MSPVNHQILLARRPSGEPTPDDFKLVESPVPAVGPNQVLVRHHYLSLDPYMRGRMDERKSYAPSQPLNEVMIGGTAGEVVASNNERFRPGDTVVGFGGWQEYQLLDAAQLNGASLTKVNATHIPLSAFLGALGVPGVTAWIGLAHICEARSGETVLVSSAAGAVGGAVGQIAKARGCRAIGIAGGPEKCRYVVEELGFDACIDYKQHPTFSSLSAALAAAAPRGIDCNFENVGGMIFEAVLANMNDFGRVAVCGLISGYNSEPGPITHPALILVKRLKVQGFIISDRMDLWPAAFKELGALTAAGKLRYRETVTQGLAKAPAAFLDLLRGRGIGKHLVKLI